MAAPSVIFEMLRSFVELAKTLNVSRTAEQIGQSRQTIKRHIRQLEEIKGKTLFEVRNRQYVLTADGLPELKSAEMLLKRLDTWLNKEYETVAGLPRLHYADKTANFWGQRYPATQIETLAPPLLKRGLQLWSDAGCQLEHSKLQKLRPYLIVYRQVDAEWLCIEVGEKSSFSTWLGPEWAQSSIGVSFHLDPVSAPYEGFMIGAYDDVARTGSVWYDHIHTQVRREENGEPQPVNYQRLVMALAFPNGEQAVASLVARTNNIQIEGLNPAQLPKMNTKDLMEFEI